MSTAWVPRGCQHQVRCLVDEMAVERLMSLQPSPDFTTPCEVREAVRRLHAQGHNDAEIATRVGCSDRHVHRTRVIMGLPAVEDAQSHKGRVAS